MSNDDHAGDLAGATDALRACLKSQYHATLAMLRQAVELCPDEGWASKDHLTATWQVAYHTVFFAHLYLQPSNADFRPWEHHQAEVQVPDCIPGPPDPESPLPLIPDPYTRAQVLEYLAFTDQMVDDTIDATDVFSSDSGFSWYPIPKLEHQIVNLRHIQHGAAQIADRVRAHAEVGVDWVGARRG